MTSSLIQAKPLMSNPRIAVVVVTYNGATWIAHCLRSLRAHDHSTRTVVVDNASNDATVATIERDFPEVSVLKLTKNVGFGRGNNVGIAQAIAWNTEYVLLLNQDAYLLPGTLAQMAHFMDDHPEYGACSPIHCSPDEHQLDLKTFRYYVTRYGDQYLRDLVMGRARNHYSVRGVNAAAWFVRTETFARIGGFDPLFFMYGEDDDFLARMAHHKIDFALLTTIRVVHQRQSPLKPNTGLMPRIKRKIRGRYAFLLNEIKLPQHSLTFMTSLLVSKGFIQPVGQVLVDWDLEGFVGNITAAGCVGWRFFRIWKHARLTSHEGPHFIDLQSTLPAEYKGIEKPEQNFKVPNHRVDQNDG